MALDAICFDAEPLLAYYWDAEGSDIVEDHFADILQNRAFGECSDVTLCEVRYHILRASDQFNFFHFHEFLIETIELEVVSTNKTWRLASDLKADHSIALGDAFSVATAILHGSTLIVGADDDFDQLTNEVDMERIRTVPD